MRGDSATDERIRPILPCYWACECAIPVIAWLGGIAAGAFWIYAGMPNDLPLSPEGTRIFGKRVIAMNICSRKKFA